MSETLNWSDSYDALEVGQTFSTRGRTITEADVVGFANLTGDRNPQHTDAQWSAAGPFGERIAHGMLVISFAAGLVTFDPDRVIALRRVADAVLKRPVRFGDTLHVTGRVAELKLVSDEAGLVTFTWNVINQDDKTVCRAKVEVLWSRDAVSEPADPLSVDENGFVPIPL
jgi:3-hydroxybutyryl-CoA dehydratase